MRSSKTSHLLLITFLLFLGVFAVLEYANISLLLASSVGNMSMYLGKDELVRKYDESLLLAKRGDLTEAKSLLSPLLNEKTIQNPSDVFELYGDLVYSMSGSSGDILPFYHRALEQGENLRIEKKIALIEQDQSQSSQTGSADSGATEQNNSGSTIVSSGTMDREMKKQDIESLQKNRAGLINYSPDTTEELQSKVQDAFSVLGGGEEKRDW